MIEFFSCHDGEFSCLLSKGRAALFPLHDDQAFLRDSRRHLRHRKVSQFPDVSVSWITWKEIPVRPIWVKAASTRPEPPRGGSFHLPAERQAEHKGRRARV